jgi:hypothetical protein
MAISFNYLIIELSSPCTQRSSDSKCSINVEWFEFYVAKNLELALQQLRSRRSSVILWVDAICINQDKKNVKELNTSVGLMTVIYKTARLTAMWLGPEKMVVRLP